MGNLKGNTKLAIRARGQRKPITITKKDRTRNNYFQEGQDAAINATKSGKMGWRGTPRCLKCHEQQKMTIVEGWKIVLSTSEIECNFTALK